MRSFSYIFICFGLSLIALNGSAAEPVKVEPTKDTLPTVKKHLAEKQAVLIDVRSEDEWKSGHIAGAIHLPLAEIKKRADDKAALAAWLREKLPADKIVYVHCMAGIRAKQACGILAPADQRDWRCLSDGYEDLLDAGFPKAELSTSTPR